jgi:hypothetical protein
MLTAGSWGTFIRIMRKTDMKRSATVLAFAAVLLLAPMVAGASHDRDYDRDHRRDYYYPYNWQYAQPYTPVVTTPYWCGTYYSSYPCPTYQPYYYPAYQTRPLYYQPYPNYASYYNQPGYWNGGAWVPYYNW